MERVSKIINSNQYKEILLKIANLEKGRVFCKHTFEHFIETARICYILYLEDTMHKNKRYKDLSKEVVYAAGLLHDIGRPEEYKTGVDHALIGAEMAIAFLREAEFKEKEIDIIKTAIKEHRRLSSNPTYLGELLYKADKLSRPCYNCKALDECYKRELIKSQMYLQY